MSRIFCPPPRNTDRPRDEPDAMTRHPLLALSIATLTLAGCIVDLPTDEPDTGSEGAEESTGDPEPSTTTDGETPDALDTAGRALCAPGATEVCVYAGPVDTESVGTCTAAVRTCDEAGVWGPCTGEVLPRAEDCRTQRDENCDGRVACDGEIEWLRGLGERPGGPSGPARASAVTVDAAGHGWLTGSYQQSLQIGEHSHDVGDGRGLFVAEFDRQGAPRFVFADERAGAFGTGVALAHDGGRLAIAAANDLRLAIHADAPAYETPEDTSAAVLAVMTTSGEYAWSRALMPVADGRVSLRALAFTATGELWAGGTSNLSGVKTTDTPLLLANHGGHDAILVKFGRAGQVAWAGSFGGAGAQSIHDIAVDPAGDVWLVGAFTGAMQFTGGSLHASASDGDTTDMFVVKLDAAGAWQWGHAYGDEQYQEFNQIELDGAGGALLFGENQGAVEGLGAEPLVDAGLVVARYDRAGAVLWARHWACEGGCDVARAAVDGAGQAVVSVNVYPGATTTINEQPFVAPGDAELGVVVKLDRGGLTVWSAAPFPGHVDLAVGPAGEVFVAGDHQGATSFGAGALVLDAGAGDRDLYVARLRP